MRILTFGFSFLAVLSVMSSGRAETPPAELRIGLPSQVGSSGKPELGTATAYIDRVVAKDFAGSPTKIVWVPVPSAGPGVNEALAGGQIDFAYYGDFPAVIGRAGNLTTKLILGGKRGMNSYLLVPAGSTANSIKDLKGKRLAVNKGRPWNFAFSRLLATNDLKESDFQIFNLSPGDGAAALLTGNVDALYQPEPFATVMEERKQARVIWSTRNLPLGWKFTLDLFVTDKFSQQYPESTQKLVNSFVKAAKYASLPENREEILRSSVTAGASYDMLVKEFENEPLREQMVPLVDAFTRAHYTEVVTFLHEQKMIRKPFAIDDFIDSRFVASALKSQDLENYWPAADKEGKPITPANP
ncbi:PhnD/SsuA/transferrin family substrate-binding protein [Bradyrhizobium sp. KBS0727]|jgi:sulfonate transport system substrate-binding protein|uniref:ABC transporter substrate-binding protein n=1 Tax=unclassified Bradyrhizobium TaxID=2631580 RepID=UPI00110F08D3|nr:MULTISPECIES: PhnD/SsuA/transferrin family substrate-binding protein [unclassified Bradyrhizobium]QDW36894.1 PhnD/SsuA/transferrin family substrate-binding protein [Bradyrhizobium sp. KBS0725]QDW43494.1 PhnD/SsuA/transferrin family substrate-binding protein [Bradyrhizobium sp. KBS0727]